MHVDYRVALIQPKVGHLARFDFDDVAEVVRRGEEEAISVLTSHAATRDLVRCGVVEGLACPVTPRDFVSIRIDPTACIGCGHVRDGVRDRRLLGARREGDGAQALELRVHARPRLRAQLPDGRDQPRQSLRASARSEARCGARADRLQWRSPCARSPASCSSSPSDPGRVPRSRRSVRPRLLEPRRARRASSWSCSTTSGSTSSAATTARTSTGARTPTRARRRSTRSRSAEPASRSAARLRCARPRARCS